MNKIGISIKFCIYFDTHIRFRELTILSYLHFLQALNAYAQRTEHFQRYAKLKVYLYANIYQFRFEYHQVLKIEGPE